MWKINKSIKNEEETNLKCYRILHFLFIVFIACWMIGVYFYIKEKYEVPHATDVTLTSDSFYFSTNHLNPNNTTPVQIPDYVVLEKYNIGDIVTIRYFLIEGVVVNRSIPSGENYSILYKDINHTLHKITLPKKMLMIKKSPVSFY